MVDTGPRRGGWYLLALALLVTFLNSVKPITSDDNTYYFRAQKMAQHPLDPYGGETLAWESPWACGC